MKKEKWEKQFDERWGSYIAKSDKQKHFVKELIKWQLQQEREWIIEEIEKKKIPDTMNGTFVREGGYNQAIEDIIKILN